MDIAEIGFRADTKDLKSAEADLDKVSGAAKKTQKASDDLASGFNKSKGAASGFFSSIREGGKSFSVVETGALAARKAVTMFIAALAPLAAIMIASFSVQPIFEFKDELAKIATLVDTTTFAMDKMEDLLE